MTMPRAERGIGQTGQAEFHANGHRNGHESAEAIGLSVPLTVSLEDERAKRVDIVGGKAASLAELRTISGIKVPEAFILSTSLFEQVLQHYPEIRESIEILDKNSAQWLEAKLAGDKEETEAKLLEDQIAVRSESLRRAIKDVGFLPETTAKIDQEYKSLCSEAGEKEMLVAVRSSCTLEDRDDKSFAGQYDTLLFQRGKEQLVTAVKTCLASQFNETVVVYRNEGRLKVSQNFLRDHSGEIDMALAASEGLSHGKSKLAVVVQRMVNASAAGTAFSVDSVTGAPIVKVESNYGVGETVVSGTVTPDSHEVGIRTGAIIGRTLGEKGIKKVYTDKGVEDVEVLPEERERFALSDDQVKEVASAVVSIARAYGKQMDTKQMDTEFAFDEKGELYFLQARPETVSSAKDQMIIEMREFSVNEDAAKRAEKVLQGGKMGSPGAAVGKVMAVSALEEAKKFLGEHKNEDVILVTRMTSPDWVPVIKKTRGIITEIGGTNCHAAIVTRELGMPCLVGVGSAINSLHTGEEITLDARNATVYKGIVPLEKTGKDIDVRELLNHPTELSLGIIMANPDGAKRLHALAELGKKFKVSLLRAEFILGTTIGVHVNALVDYDRGLVDKNLRGKIKSKLEEFGYTSGREYFIGRYSEGIASIADKFPNSDIVLRTTDFKTNEYTELIGGKEYESSREENPMMGIRGLLRFLLPENQEGFKWELEAIKRARDMGYKNIEIMFPMVRHPYEISGNAVQVETGYGKGVRSAYEIMKEVGLERGRDGLKVIMMVENPSNVFLINEFIDAGIDGISIGSNDLTQFIVAVDRDNEKLMLPAYSEMHPAVIDAVKQVLRACKKRGVETGICGNAPSNHPEFARMLVEEGIDSIGVMPDRILETHKLIREAEQKRKLQQAPAATTAVPTSATVYQS